MSLFKDFNQNDHLVYSKSKQAARDKRVAEGLKALSESYSIQNEIDAAKKQVDAEMYLENTIGNVVNKAIVNRKRNYRQEAKLQESLMQKVLVGFLTETTIKGLVFDKYFLEENYDSIKNESNKIFNKLFEEKVLSEDSFRNCNSLLIQEAYQELKEFVLSAIKNRDIINALNEDTVSTILAEARKSKDLTEEIADNVKEKVTDTLEKEKKISKKKEEEKKKDEEEKAAADSLDNDVDQETGDGNTEPEQEEPQDPNAAGGEGGEPVEPGAEGDAGQEPQDPNAAGGEGGEPNDPNVGGEEPSDEPAEPNDPNAEGDVEQEPQDPNAAGGEPAEPNDPNAGGDAGQEPNAPQGGSGGLTVNVVDVKGNKISITSSESTDYLQNLHLFGRNRWKERNSKTLFRNMLESNLQERVNMLSENGGVSLNVDNVLGETIVEYTLLETLYTSKLLDLSTTEIKSLVKTLNFNRK